MAPIIVVHRRNTIADLAVVPAGAWIEFDAEAHAGGVSLTHDPLAAGAEAERLEPFLTAALARGVAGFVIDCKREAIERSIAPVLKRLGIADYFYLNEMEVQADIFMEADAGHSSGIRVWKYRGAADVIRYAEDRRAAGLAYPRWIWLDCWDLGLTADIGRAHLPITGEEAARLQALGVRICVCSPELYVHKYGVAYTDAELGRFHAGIADYRRKLEERGIVADAICTKFPAAWR